MLIAYRRQVGAYGSDVRSARSESRPTKLERRDHTPLLKVNVDALSFAVANPFAVRGGYRI